MKKLGIAALVLALLIGLAWRSGDRPELDEVTLASHELGVALESQRIAVGEVTLHVVSAGPEDGPAVLLLHGFPEFWYSWHRQLAALARAGYRVHAPDLRGYNRSDKPPEPADYTGARFASDAIGLLDALAIERVFVAGHDVGGGVVWRLIALHPERLRAALLFNTAHPLAWERARPQDDEETISWFRSFFQLPWLPELVGRAGDWWLLSRNLRETSRPGTFEPARLDVYKAAWARDNAIHTMIHVYRAAQDAPLPSSVWEQSQVPVRVVWGEGDRFFPPKAGDITEEILGDEFVRVPRATHWILLEEPELTAREMIAFFGRYGGPPTRGAAQPSSTSPSTR